MAPLSPSTSNSTMPNAAADLTKQLRSHEVAIAELNNLPSSRLAPLMAVKGSVRYRGSPSHFQSLDCHKIRMKTRILIPFMICQGVYHRNGNLFFRTTIQAATTLEQKQLDSAKAKLKSLNSSS